MATSSLITYRRNKETQLFQGFKISLLSMCILTLDPYMPRACRQEGNRLSIFKLLAGHQPVISVQNTGSA